MQTIYQHIDLNDFSINIPEWTVLTGGTTWDRHRAERSTRIAVLTGHNMNGDVVALFQEEQWGLYHYYRCLDGQAFDFDTSEAVAKALVIRLGQGYRIQVRVEPRPQRRVNWVDGQVGKLIGVREITTHPRKRYLAQVAFPISLVEGSNNPDDQADIIREIDFEDLVLKFCYLPNPERDNQPMADSAIN